MSPRFVFNHLPNSTHLEVSSKSVIRTSGLALVMVIFTLIFSACTTEEDADPATDPDTNPPTAGVVKSNVTEITFINNGAKNPTLISFHNGTQALPGFEVKSDGTTQIKFFGKNGRDILQGDAFGLSINMANFYINDGDTIRIYQGEVLKYEYITKSLDNTLDDGIRFTSIGESAAQAKERFNNYIKNEMPTQKFKPL